MNEVLKRLAPRIEVQIAELEQRLANWPGPKHTLDYAWTKINLQTAKELYEEAKNG